MLIDNETYIFCSPSTTGNGGESLTSGSESSGMITEEVIQKTIDSLVIFLDHYVIFLTIYCQIFSFFCIGSVISSKIGLLMKIMKCYYAVHWNTLKQNIIYAYPVIWVYWYWDKVFKVLGP